MNGNTLPSLAGAQDPEVIRLLATRRQPVPKPPQKPPTGTPEKRPTAADIRAGLPVRPGDLSPVLAGSPTIDTQELFRRIESYRKMWGPNVGVDLVRIGDKEAMGRYIGKDGSTHPMFAATEPRTILIMADSIEDVAERTGEDATAVAIAVFLHEMAHDRTALGLETGKIKAEEGHHAAGQARYQRMMEPKSIPPPTRGIPQGFFPQFGPSQEIQRRRIPRFGG